MKVTGKVAIITGGAQGLGKGFAEALLEDGALVVIADVNDDRAIETVREFQRHYGIGKAAFLKCDVAKQEDLQRVFEKTKEMFGFVVVNNAGVNEVSNRTVIIDVNLKGVVEGSYLALQYMSKGHGGRGGLIVNIASAAGLIEAPFVPVYAATKHGVVGLTRALGTRRDDVIDEGIRVSCVCPTFAMTPMLEEGMARQKDKKIRERFIAELGIMQISDVVNAFMKVVQNDTLHAGVVLVQKGGVDVQFPLNLKGKL